MWSYFAKGGIMMWPLLLCSIFSWAIILERTYFFWKTIFGQKAQLHRLLQHLGQKRLEEAVKLAERMRHPAAAMLKFAAAKAQEGRGAAERSLGEAESIVAAKLEKYMGLLAFLASISTLMGFTGTVLGMIRAFESIVQAGVSSPAVVASGIAEALVTTAAGLLIAIPAFAFHAYFNHLIERTETEISRVQRLFLNSV